MSDSLQNLKESVRKRKASELIKELLNVIPISEKESLRNKISTIDVETLADAVVQIRVANGCKKPMTSAGVVPSDVYTLLDLDDPQTSRQQLGPEGDIGHTDEDIISTEIDQQATNVARADRDVLRVSESGQTPTGDVSQMMMFLMTQMREDRQREIERREEEKQRDIERREEKRMESERHLEMMKLLTGNIATRLNKSEESLNEISQNLGQLTPMDNMVKEIGQAIGKMPDVGSKIPEYFDVLETYLNQRKVSNDKEEWLYILRHLIGFHGNKVIMGLPLEGSTYFEVKEMIFSHYGISPNLYYDRFYGAKKANTTTYRAFTEMLCDNLQRYLELSKVEYSYEALFDKIVHDRLKATLPDKLIGLANQWEFRNQMNARDLASFADQMSINGETYRMAENIANKKFCKICKRTNHNTNEHRNPEEYRNKTENSRHVKATWGRQMSKEEWEYKCKMENLCFGCGNPYDRAHNCLKRKQYFNEQTARAWHSNQNQTTSSNRRGEDRREDRKDNNYSNKDRRRIQRLDVSSGVEPSVQSTIINTDRKYLANENEENQITINRTIVEENLDVDKHKAEAEYDKIEIPIDRQVSVMINGIRVDGIIDSGADASVICADVHPSLCIKGEGPTVILEGPFGDSRSAELMTVPCALLDKETMQKNPLTVPLTLAVCKDLRTERLLLSSQDYYTLRRAYIDSLTNEVISPVNNDDDIQCTLPTIEYSCSCDNIHIDGFCDKCQYLKFLPTVKEESQKVQVRQIAPDANIVENNNSAIVGDQPKQCNDRPPSGNKEEIKCDSNSILKEQQEDESLKAVLHRANNGDKVFYVHEKTGLLYRRSYYRNILREQLVLPQSRRNQVLEQAHDKLFGGHFAEKKTRAKIETYFWWPSISKDVRYHTKGCETCQRKRMATVRDKIPIKFIPRGTQSFDVLVADVLGPFDSSSQKHKWCLTVVDLYSRFPFIYPLKSLKPQEICQCFLQIFCTFGIPSKIVTDQGTNFCSTLNSEFAKVFGFTHALCIPGRKESTGLAERHNANIEKLLHQILISDKKRNWSNLCPIIAWTLRDTVNDTTGLTPFELVFGHEARSPMALLRDNWGSEDFNKLKKPYKQYMSELSNNLEIVAKIAEANCKITQKRYEEFRNEGTRPKSFNVGDRVVILIPDSTFKIRSQWGLGTVLSKVGRDSYRVQMDETGQIRILHADKLRNFYSRVQHLGVLIETKNDFINTGLDNQSMNDLYITGGLPPSETYDTPDGMFQQVDLSHLSEDERNKILAILRKHSKLFSDKPGNCNVCEHNIEIKDDFVPKQLSTYRFPQKLISQIEEKILAMEAQGKIVKSSSKMVSPMLVVAKPDGGLRIVVDYRYVNQYTEPQNFPIPRVDDMLHRISDSNFITCLDVSSAYHTIPLRESDQYLSAFVCHLGVYEYTVAPMGLKYSGCTFQKAINHLLMPHLRYAFSYVDDTSVYSNVFNEHLAHLDGVLTTYEEAGLTINLLKCQFAKPKVKFLGHMVGSGQISMLQSKVEAIDKVPLPTTKKAVRSFIGALNFYNKFIANFSDIAKPLFECLKKGTPNRVKLNEPQVQAFNRLKQALKSAPVLSMPNYEKEFVIQCDASKDAVGSVLLQCDDSGDLKPIAFASHKFTSAELNWDIVSKEAFAVIYSLRHFQNIIFRCKILLFSDHNPLQFAVANVPRSAKLQRWALELQSYDIEVRYIKTDDNVVADWLSRYTA